MQVSQNCFSVKVQQRVGLACYARHSQSSHPLTSVANRLARFVRTHVHLELPQLGDSFIRHRVLPYHDWQAGVPGGQAVGCLVAQPVSSLRTC